MERSSLRSRRRALARATVVAIATAAAVPALATADRPDTAGNGPPGPAGNPNQQSQSTHGKGRKPESRPSTPSSHSRGRAVRAQGSPSQRQSGTDTATTRQSRGSDAPAAADRPASRQGPRQGPSKSNASTPHGNNGAAHQKTTICHATGSDTNPYVEITISDRALKAHDRHQNDEDMIPAPDEGCPGGATLASTVQSVAAPIAAVANGEAPAANETRAVRRESGPTEGTPDSRVLGVVQENTPGGAAGTKPAAASGGAENAVAATTEATDDGSLPFTGLELALLVAAGIALVLAGVATRRVVAARQTAA